MSCAAQSLQPPPVPHWPNVDTILRLLRAASTHDRETGAHLGRISHLAGALAEHRGLARGLVERVRTAAALHDIGKIAVAGAILNKPGPLDPREWNLVKQHPVVGAALLHGSLSPLLQCAREIALNHHECWDGSGYPNGLRGDAIPPPAHIVMLCDQYDALRSPRPYKPAFDHETTCRILFEGDGRTRPEHFDPDLLELFKKVHPRFQTLWRTLTETRNGSGKADGPLVKPPAGSCSRRPAA